MKSLLTPPAWPTLDEASRQQIRGEISRMLDWCLAKSYQPDGSFKVSDLDDTQGDAYRYGIWFLQEAGYFQRRDRFWADQDSLIPKLFKSASKQS